MIHLNHDIINISLLTLQTLYFFATCTNSVSKCNKASNTRSNVTLLLCSKSQYFTTSNHCELLTIDIVLQHSHTYVIQRRSTCPDFFAFHSWIHPCPETNTLPHEYWTLDRHVGLRSHDRYLIFNPLNAELNPTCHLLALLGAHTILDVSGGRVNH
jgi:hypothetical protein